MRDPTRGGLATTLNEIVSGMGFGIKIFEEAIPIKEEIKAACEILGFDPLYLANEGKVVVIAPEESAQTIIKTMRQNPLGKESQIIGEIVKDSKGKVIMKTEIGGSRIIEMLAGDQLPRIC
jgi:hydrogenase expression/formation protein HypE